MPTWFVAETNYSRLMDSKWNDILAMPEQKLLPLSHGATVNNCISYMKMSKVGE